MANMSIPVLPPELLHIIFSNLKGHADYYSLCLVSKYFYTVAIRLLYRRLKIPHSTPGRLVAPLHAVLSSQQQERLLRFSAGEEDGLVRGGEKGPGFDKDLSDCGELVREFELADLINSVEEGAEIRREIIESAIDNMSHLESFVWTTSNRLGLRRTPRICASLARKPLLHSLSLSNIVDTDIPLLQLHPLYSVTFILDSNFPSLAHRLAPSTADYDIIRKILKTSSGTLKSLSLITAEGLWGQAHYEDERLIFGGEEGSHKSVFENSPEGAEVTHLDRLESLTLVERMFTERRLEVLTQAINFNNLRRLEIVSCRGAGLLLSTITPPKDGELGKGAEGAPGKENRAFPNLRIFRIKATQSALTKFLQCFRGLRDLHYELECEPTDWSAPGGNRRQVSSFKISRDLLEAIATYHGDTLQRLATLSFDQRKIIDESGMKILTGRCRVLEKLCCCVTSSSFSDQAAATPAPSGLSTLYFHVQALISESEAREFVQKAQQQLPKLKKVGMLTGRGYAIPFVFRARPDGVLERVFVDGFLERDLRVGDFGD